MADQDGLIYGYDNKSAIVRQHGRTTELNIFGPRGELATRLELNKQQAAKLATALMKAYRQGAQPGNESGDRP